MPDYSATHIIQLDQNCYNCAVFLRWLTPNGGWDGWLFTGNEDEDAAEGESNFYRPAKARVDTVLSKSVADGFTLRTDNLLNSRAQAIRFIQSSPRVQRVFKNGHTQEVKVTSYPDKIVIGAEKRQSIVLQIETGTRNTQTN